MASKGRIFRDLVKNKSPLLIAGTINATCGLLAKHAGFKAIYLSGAALSNADYGLPDLGVTSLDNVLDITKRITDAVDLPLLVDGDTGWGSTLNIARTVQQLSKLGVAAVHFEDQAFPKRCGHRAGKVLTNIAEMQNRIKAAVDARSDDSFVIMARTDAVGVDGVDAAIERAQAYVRAGADMIFAEAVTTLGDYAKFTQALGKVPVLANLTEFGATPLFSVSELEQMGIKLILYPLSAFRAMNYAASQVYQTIIQQGTQQSCLPLMQTREQLYELIDYYKFEKLIDQDRDKNVSF